MSNEQVFAGTDAYPAIEVAMALLGIRNKPHADRHMGDVIGAVMSLARHVAVIEQRVAEGKPDASAAFGKPDPDYNEWQARAALAEEINRGLYTTLIEIWRIARNQVEPGVNPAEPDAETGALQAIEARLRRLLEHSGKLPAK